MSSEAGPAPQKISEKSDGKKASRKNSDVNVALRKAYESTIDESIPQSMLDLLSKLD